jgi:molybdopterin-binding protein
VSIDTLRRWDTQGVVHTTRDAQNPRMVSREEVARLRRSPDRHLTGGTFSARNRFPGRVVSVEVDGVMALVEIQAGPHRITAAITRDSVEELDLQPGQQVAARVKATSVMVERDDGVP